MSNEIIMDIRRMGFNWGVTLFLAAFHVLAVVALFNFTWSALGVAVFMWWVAGSLGIGIGYHRLLTHRGYKTPKWLEYFLTICGTLALEGGSIPWVATHRVHHIYTERDGDPHSPRDGFFWSHMGWIINGRSLHRETESTARHAADLARDPFHVWISRWHFVPQIFVGLILYALGGWPFVLWGVFMRVVFSWHATWFVNSAAHVWGGRRFNTRDDSRNLWWVALISFGEGWHNNHHAHPSSARHGLAWYEFDVNWYGIRFLQMLGLVKSLRVAELPKGKPGLDDNLSKAA
ncbi:MAG: fatty acid desaturase [Acidobacteria bacterium]|nr:fatty acid desaturase [Acidobacteriota bacterium]